MQYFIFDILSIMNDKQRVYGLTLYSVMDIIIVIYCFVYYNKRYMWKEGL